jgi:hypothetical protein
MLRALPLLACLLASPAALAQEVRLLVLDTVALEGMALEDATVVQSFVTDALRGRERLVVATNADVRRRAPMQADRLGECQSELCLYELGSALEADWVIFSHVAKEAGAVRVRLGVLSTARGAIAREETVRGPSLDEVAPSLASAMERVLEPIFEAAVPSLFESPLFLAGAGITALGGMVFLGAAGWALELESNLRNPDRQRDDKARALAQGPASLAVSAVGLGITAIGAALLLTATLWE